MKKEATRWWTILAAVLVVYNVIVFAIPFGKPPVLSLSWAFTMIAIAAQVYVFRIAFGRDAEPRSKFYGFPIAKIGVMYFAAQLVLGLVFMVLGTVVSIPMWIPSLVMYIILLGTAATGFVVADTAREEIVRQDVKLKKDVSRMRALQSKMASMVRLAQDDAVRTALEKFAEDIRFSDPVSSEALEAVEADLSACTDDLQQAVLDNDCEAALSLEKGAEMLLVERNRLCKLEKRAAH